MSSSAGMTAGGGGRRGGRNDGAGGKKSGAKGSAIPSSRGKNFGRPFRSEFLTETFSAVSRSVSPAVRPKNRRKWGAREPTEEEGRKEDGGSVASTPGVGARPRVGWGGSRDQRPSPGFPSPLTDTVTRRQRDRFEADGSSQDEVDDSPITIGPAAAAAAAAAEAASAQAFADTELAGIIGRSPGGVGNGAAARSRADEHDAKLLLFGRQLGGGSGGAGGGGGAGGVGASTSSNTGKSLLSIGLPQGLKSKYFPGKKGGGGGGTSAAGGTLKRAGEAEGK